ncbi:flagellin [Dickeya chrysanthemi]|uniref:flagellin N-terminal helical domain-containing protein n=1 Tax=Dickeya chrysanthemi TaxID=556 RepID=UPI0025A219E9|nr:flagellin [Dickeya chrysanthemi]WJM86711.1 flagellin [Dickeya chrysanthemi]
MISLTDSGRIRSNYDRAVSNVKKDIESLSSGLRINNAKDDAAGVAITDQLTANINSDSMIMKGINDAISLVQTAESGVDNIMGKLQRARELALQSANETLNDRVRQTIQLEYATLLEDIDRTAMSTTIFDKYPLAPTTRKQLPQQLGSTLPLSSRFPVSGNSYSFNSGIISVAYIPAGAKNLTISIDSLGADDDIEIFSRDGKHLVGTPLEGSNPDIVWKNNGVTDQVSATAKVLTTANGFLAGASYDASSLLEGGAAYNINGSVVGTYNGMTLTYSGDGDRYENASNGGFNDGNNGSNLFERVNIDNVAEDLILMVIGSGAFTGQVKWDALPTPSISPLPPLPPISEPVSVLLQASVGGAIDTLVIDPTPSDTDSLGLTGTVVTTRSNALNAIGLLDKAMQTLNGYLGQYGSLANRFESLVDLNIRMVSTGKAVWSRYRDLDMSSGLSEFVKNTLIQQQAINMLTISAQDRDTILKLLLTVSK